MCVPACVYPCGHVFVIRRKIIKFLVYPIILYGNFETFFYYLIGARRIYTAHVQHRIRYITGFPGSSRLHHATFSVSHLSYTASLSLFMRTVKRVFVISCKVLFMRSFSETTKK